DYYCGSYSSRRTWLF
nr:immunoglobulin light chain junction region [Macaca mulatta]